MSAPKNESQAQWSHRCLACALCFNSVDLEMPCPGCQNSNHRQTTSLIWYLDKEYGSMTPEEWSTTLGIEDLTNPVDAPEGE